MVLGGSLWILQSCGESKRVQEQKTAQQHQHSSIELSHASPVPSLATASEVPAKPTHYFNDYASLIDQRTAQQLDRRLGDFEQQTSNQILVVIYPALPVSTAIEDFALTAFRAWKPGQQGRNNGAILFVFVEDRKMRISTGYVMEAALPNEVCKRIVSDKMAPRFQAGDFSGGVSAAVNAMMAATKAAYTGTGKTVAEQKLPTN